jgi:flagellar biosynthetic protein FliQ
VTAATVHDLVRLSIWTILVASSPAVVAAMLVGTAIALLQALTQVQESTLSFVPKIVAVLLALLVAADFMATQVMVVTEQAYGQIEHIGR